MYRLTREVRFAINPVPDEQLSGKPTNSYAGFPSLTGLGVFLAARVTLVGGLDPLSNYLENIKKIDDVVRGYLPDVEAMVRTKRSSAADLVYFLHGVCYEHWRERFESVALLLSPYLSLAAHRPEVPMLRLSQRFEFAATHRLHNPALGDAENRATYGKCNNPHGHGHNYEVQVTLKGVPNQSGLLVDVPAFERIVAATVIDRFDHKNLNVEVPEFSQTGLIPSVENIAMTIYRLLKPKFADAGAQLGAVTVWETPKTWCEYSE